MIVQNKNGFSFFQIKFFSSYYYEGIFVIFCLTRLILRDIHDPHYTDLNKIWEEKNRTQDLEEQTKPDANDSIPWWVPTSKVRTFYFLRACVDTEKWMRDFHVHPFFLCLDGEEIKRQGIPSSLEGGGKSFSLLWCDIPRRRGKELFSFVMWYFSLT